MATRETTSKPAWRLPTVLSLRTLILASILFGIGVSGYLSYVKFTDEAMVCAAGGTFNCSTVQDSAYATLAGVPIAYLGLVTYLVLGGLVLLEGRSGIVADFGPTLMFLIGLFAWAFSMWLVYVQFVILEALCQWCLMHEANFTLLFGLITLRVWQHLNAGAAD